MRASRPRFRPSIEECKRLAAAFGAAAQTGDIEALTGLLTEDVIYYTDAGGKAPAPLRPIFGRDKVLRLMKGLSVKGASSVRQIHPAQINGIPGFAIEPTSGEMATVTFDFRDGRIAGVYLTLNPDKLRHLPATRRTSAIQAVDPA